MSPVVACGVTKSENSKFSTEFSTSFSSSSAEYISFSHGSEPCSSFLYLRRAEQP